MGSKMRYFIVVGVSVTLSFLIFYAGFGIAAKKEGFVNMIKLNDQFELKINLQKKLDKELKGYHQILDNLKLEMQAVYNDSLIKGNERFVIIKQLQANIESKTYEFSENEQELTNRYNSQIREQLNEYIKLYGKEKNIDVLFGAEGNGTILYGKEEYDYTLDCIEYVNNKYKGE